MPKENELFWRPNFQDTESVLFNTKPDHPWLDADDVDFEMQFTKRSDRLLLRNLSQDGLEHFVRKYGENYQLLHMENCTRIRDLSPLGDLPNLEAIKVEWCRCAALWDMSGNRNLKILSIGDCKKLAFEPKLLETGKQLEEVRFWGPVSSGTYPMTSLECFRGMTNLRRIDLNWIRLEDKSMDFLATLPKLEEFHFDAGMLTTEEIAQIVARYPRLYGQCLGAYDDEYSRIGEIRICGTRKPTLQLPKQQKRLEEYVRQFNTLVAHYRSLL